MSLLGENKIETTQEVCPLCKRSEIQKHPNFFCCRDLRCRFLYLVDNNYGENEKPSRKISKNKIWKEKNNWLQSITRIGLG